MRTWVVKYNPKSDPTRGKKGWRATFVEAIEEGERDWWWPFPTTPYVATYSDLQAFDRVLFYDSKQKRFFASGVVDGRRGTQDGQVLWEDDEGFTHEVFRPEWWMFVLVHAIEDGVPIPKEFAKAVAHPDNRYGGQNAPMAPLPALAGDLIATALVEQWRSEQLRRIGWES